MERIEWRAGLTIGVGLFDSQHQHLVKLVNDLIDEFNSGNESDRIPEAIDNLLEHTHSHFEYEEQSMLHYGFGGYVPHKKLHTDFLKTAEQLAEVVKHRDTHIPEELLTLVRSWFVHHITIEDREYKLFLEKSWPPSS